MKFGSKMHLGEGEFKLIGTRAKIDGRSISGVILVFCPRLLVKMKISNFSVFRSIHNLSFATG